MAVTLVAAIPLSAGANVGVQGQASAGTLITQPIGSQVAPGQLAPMQLAAHTGRRRGVRLRSFRHRGTSRRTNLISKSGRRRGVRLRGFRHRGSSNRSNLISRSVGRSGISLRTHTFR